MERSDLFKCNGRWPDWWRAEKHRRAEAERQRKAGTLVGRFRAFWRKYIA